MHKFVKNVSNSLSIPSTAKRDVIAPILYKYIDTVLTKGSDTRSEIDGIFDEVYKCGREILELNAVLTLTSIINMFL